MTTSGMMPEEPTTPDLEEAVRRSVDAFNRRDFDATLAMYRADAVWDTSPIGVGVFEGREAIRGTFEDWLAAYEGFEQVIEEFRDLGGVTFAVLLQRARPQGSSGVVALRLAVVGAWRDGLVERFTIYTDIDEARAAAERLAEERVQPVPEESATPDVDDPFRRHREALNRGNLDAAVAMYAPDAVWDVSLLGLEGVFEGREEIRGALEDLIAPYDDLEIVAEESRDLGSGVTLVVFLVRGRLKGSTRFVESRMASVSTWANGLIERITNYPDIDEARGAAVRLAQERG